MLDIVIQLHILVMLTSSNNNNLLSHKKNIIKKKKIQNTKILRLLFVFLGAAPITPTSLLNNKDFISNSYNKILRSHF